MAQQYDNELSGMLSKNTYKTEDKHPTLTGVAQIDGVKYKVAAWPKETKDGQKIWSMKYTPADQKGPPKTNAPARKRDELEY